MSFTGDMQEGRALLLFSNLHEKPILYDDYSLKEYNSVYVDHILVSLGDLQKPHVDWLVSKTANCSSTSCDQYFSKNLDSQTVKKRDYKSPHGMKCPAVCCVKFSYRQAQVCSSELIRHVQIAVCQKRILRMFWGSSIIAFWCCWIKCWFPKWKLVQSLQASKVWYQ